MRRRVGPARGGPPPPLSPDSVVSPAVEVQGLGFSWESYHAEGGWVDLYLSAPSRDF